MRLNSSYLLFGQWHTFSGDLFLVEAALDIVGAVAVINPIDEIEQTTERERGISGLYQLIGVHRQVAQLVNAEKRTPHALVQAFLEAVFMQKRSEVILVGHADGRVGSINPFDGKLKRLTTAHRTHGRRGRKDLLSLNTCIRKQLVIGALLFQKVEVHSGSLIPKVVLGEAVVEHLQLFNLLLRDKPRFVDLP